MSISLNPSLDGTLGQIMQIILFRCPVQKGKKTRNTGFSGFPGSSTGKESTCNEGDPSLIPGAGRSPGEGIGYPKLQYSWASLVVQTVNNLPKMRETCIPSLGWEDLLEDEMVTYSSTLAWRIRMDRGTWVRKESDMTERLSTGYFKTELSYETF